MQKINEQLRCSVEKVFGQKVTDKYSCQQLADKITKAAKERISYQTIRRYWQLINAKDISIQSKNILCRYVGYNDWNDFLNTTKVTAVNAKLDWTVLKPFYHCNSKAEHLENAAYWYEKMGRSFASFILTNESVFESFAQEMHHSEIAMKYVISFHPMYDNLGKDWYFRGLRLFLRHTDVSHYKIFGNAVEGMRCVYTNQQQKLKHYIANIKSLLPTIRKEYGIVWPLEARVLGLMMIEAKYRNDDNAITELKEECFALLKKHKDKRFEIDNYEIFIFILSDFLNLFGMADIAYELQQYYPLKFTQNVAWKDGYNTAGIIVRAMTLFMSDKKEKAKSLCDDVDLDMLNFDFKQYFSIQYCNLQISFSTNAKQRTKLKKQVNELIEHTGLAYFNTLISQ